MLHYLYRRLASMVPVLLLISLCVFAFIRALPGDPARLLAGLDASAADVELVRSELGLDRPLLVQYFSFLGSAVRGDFGNSLKSGRPVLTEIGERFPATMGLTLLSMAWAIFFGLLFGVGAAVYRNQLPDRILMTLAVVGISLPSFWFGLTLIDVFAVQLNWLPTGGFEEGWRSFILPSLTLGLSATAVTARFARSSLIEVMNEDYIRTAKAKGVPARQILFRHVFRNALIPVVTMLGLQFGFLLGGAIVTETVFSWPGMGRLLVDAVSYRDYPVIQTEILIFSLQFLLINLVVDILYAFLNPQVRY